MDFISRTNDVPLVLSKPVSKGPSLSVPEKTKP